MKRRAFLENSAKASLAGLFLTNNWNTPSPLFNNICVNLFSLPKVLEKDFAGGLQMLSVMGYKEIEMYGPYTFSSEKQKANWKALEPMVGFSGSGFFGKTMSETKAILKDTGLKVPSLHTDLHTLSELMGPLADAANQIGAKYVVLPAIPDEERKNIDDYKRMAERFNKIGEEAKSKGVHFTYHNHGYGLTKMEGVLPLDIILQQTDPSLVYLEMDLFWTTAGGADPIELLKANKDRYKLMHVKDMKKKVRFSGDGGNPKQWTELWGEMTTAGDGVLDLKNILAVAKENGLEHCVVEQDIVANPEIALKRSYDFCASLKK
jgi:sugar phosphate isomerase/epimerase